jgi:hypothetical protein
MKTLTSRERGWTSIGTGSHVKADRGRSAAAIVWAGAAQKASGLVVGPPLSCALLRRAWSGPPFSAA